LITANNQHTIKDSMLLSQFLLKGWITFTHCRWGPQIFQNT